VVDLRPALAVAVADGVMRSAYSYVLFLYNWDFNVIIGANKMIIMMMMNTWGEVGWTWRSAVSEGVPSPPHNSTGEEGDGRV